MKEMPGPVLDGMTELINIGIGRSAGSLNSLTGYHVTLQVPKIHISAIEELHTILPQPREPFYAISQGYTGVVDGTAVLIFPQESAEGIFLLMTGEARRPSENDELWEMTLTEVANIIVNAIMGSVSNIIGGKIEFLLPEYHEDSLDHILGQIRFSESESVVLIQARFEVMEKSISGDIVILLPDPSAETISRYITTSMT